MICSNCRAKQGRIPIFVRTVICNKCMMELHDDICSLVDYKHKLNEFYRVKYGGLDITDIMENEMAINHVICAKCGRRLEGIKDGEDCPLCVPDSIPGQENHLRRLEDEARIR